jgi:hypothetical protein
MPEPVSLLVLEFLPLGLGSHGNCPSHALPFYSRLAPDETRRPRRSSRVVKSLPTTLAPL